MNYQELMGLMIACYKHDNPSHICFNINRSQAMISYSLLTLGCPISHPLRRDEIKAFSPCFVYAYFMEVYTYFWDKIIFRIINHTGINWLEDEGFINPLIKSNEKDIKIRAEVGRQVKDILEVVGELQGAQHIYYRQKIATWSN
jgi:hypothetical protein